MSRKVSKRLFTVEEYHRMAEVGILTDGDRVELIEGELIQMPPIGSWHASVVDRINAILTSRLGKKAIVRVQGPLVLGKRSEPHPDITVLRPKPDFYASQHPGPRDVLFLIEVADSTVMSDRRLKLPSYASKGIEEVWIVDRKTDAIEVYRTPALRGFQDRSVHSRGDRLAPLAFPSTEFRVMELLGK